MRKFVKKLRSSSSQDSSAPEKSSAEPSPAEPTTEAPQDSPPEIEYAFTPLLDTDKQEAKLELFKHSYDWFLKHLPEKPNPKWTVLEAGEGKYGWSHWYLSHFKEVIGVDLEDYGHFHPGVTSITADLSKPLPLPDQSVDLIVSHSVLEHIEDVKSALENLDRVLKVGGYAFLTVSPLYFSPRGSHVNIPEKLENWEHLDPDSQYYMIDNPMKFASTKGHYLNQMTYGDFLSWTGTRPWSVIQSHVTVVPQEIPKFVDRSKASEVDLRISGFRYLAKKEHHCF